MKSTALLAALLTLAVAARATVIEKFEQTYPLAADGVISLENANGDIAITAWDRNEVSLVAEKRAKTDEELAKIKLHISSSNWDVNGHATSKLSIKTEFPKEHFGFFWFGSGNSTGSVHYRLMVPAGARLDKIDAVNSDITVTGVHGSVNLDTVNGSIEATGLKADTRLDSVNGSLSAEFISVEMVQTVKLDSVNGRLAVTLPKGATASVEADSVNGRISIAQAIKLGKSGRHEVRGEIGTGGPRLSLDTVNGSISVKER